ncbi:MAG: hypothetical protein HY525_03860 [Betaproteobacteria bacterium]|nr:hypothetical protein [Betaproteobacteria bacterium]
MLSGAKVKPCTANGLEYPLADTPALGAVRKVPPGVYWLRMPLLFALDHLNCLQSRGQLRREGGRDGIYRFARA